MLLGVSHKMLKRILSLVFNYERTSTLEDESTGRSEPEREGVDTPEVGSEQSGRSISSPSDEVKVYPFPDPWDGDWNDAVINWAMWHRHENAKRESEREKPTEVGQTETD